MNHAQGSHIRSQPPGPGPTTADAAERPQVWRNTSTRPDEDRDIDQEED